MPSDVSNTNGNSPFITWWRSPGIDPEIVKSWKEHKMPDTLEPALEAALELEREECAKVADRFADTVGSAKFIAAKKIAKAIRNRKAFAAASPQAEIDRLRLMLETLVASVRSVLVELKPGESLRPAGAGKTNILVSDVNAAERILRSLHPEPHNGGR